MQMRFTVDQEAAFQHRRAELSSDFAAWIEHHQVAADPSDAELLLDWKWGYGDGDLSRWTLADIEEFLLEWCPRKLSSPPDLAAQIPPSVASFVEFLAHRELLAQGGAAPSEVRSSCAEIGPRFRREMTDPANFGLAKSLFGDGGTPDDMLARLSLLTGSDPAHLLSELDEQPPVIGPVRLPSASEQRESLRSARTFGQVRALAERCAEPGLPVTARGNLRLADARRLVTELETGDDLGPSVRSMTALHALSWVVQLAVESGAVTGDGRRLLTGAGFAALSEPQAYRSTVRAALDEGLTPIPDGWTADELDLLESAGPQLLAELLGAYAIGNPEVPVPDLLELVDRVARVAMPGGPVFGLADGVSRQLDTLVELGVLCRGEAGTETVALTPAGVAAAAELVPELLGIEVVLRPDPATADAAAMSGALLLADRTEAEADLGAWFAAQPDPSLAADALLAQLVAAGQEPAAVLAGLDLAGAVLGEHADAAARPHLDGPHEPLVTTWMLTRGTLDPAEVDPHRALTGMVAVAGAMIDVEGPAGAVEFVRDSDDAQVLDLLEQLWRLDHPRVGDVLDGIGEFHPNRTIAKAARKNLMRYRSRCAQ